jgi:hypothetical protein
VRPIRFRALSAAIVLAALPAGEAAAQWSAQHEQFYLPASHNWVFRRQYPAADRLFNAFDYGHAILYEKLYTRPGAPASELEEREYGFITRRLLVSPPRLPVEEAAIEIEYVKLVPEAKLMFEWAHILHRQMYDVLADERLSQAEKDAEVAALLRYYRTRPDLAFSAVPKNMDLMEQQYYSTAFRDGFPKFNGLIWAYHWLQVGLYEPLMTGRTPEERQTGVLATVARFRQMLQDAPSHLPRMMPMTPAVAPTFAARYPEAAIVFDNLHGMHDVISDILASPLVPRERKRAEILRAAARYRDDTSFVMTRAEWMEMSGMMGVANMGGPVDGFLAGFPAPTVERGMTMREAMASGAIQHGGMDHGSMDHGGTNAGAPDRGSMDAAKPDSARDSHDSHGAHPAATAPASHDAHGGRAADDTAASPRAHDGHDAHAAHSEAAPSRGMRTAATDSATPMRRLHDALMADEAIRARVAADTALRRTMAELHGAAAADPARLAAAVARLLADPRVEARVHADPRLHRLWSDPDVQRQLAEARRSPPAAPAHRH